MPPLRPDNRRFLPRFVLVAGSLVLAANWIAPSAVALLLPAIEEEIKVLDDNIEIDSLAVVQDAAGTIVRMRANTIRPIYFQHFIVYPLGTLPNTHGWYQVFANARGVLLAPLLFLITLLGWPERNLRELLIRLLIGLPLLAIVLALDTPLDLLGNFQTFMIHSADRATTPPLFYWDKFLEGGGGAALAITLAALAVTLAALGPTKPAACKESVSSSA